jgi:hypothetical protein
VEVRGGHVGRQASRRDQTRGSLQIQVLTLIKQPKKKRLWRDLKFFSKNENKEFCSIFVEWPQVFAWNICSCAIRLCFMWATSGWSFSTMH